MFLVAGDHKGGSTAPLIREAIYPWNRLLVGFLCRRTKAPQKKPILDLMNQDEPTQKQIIPEELPLRK
ncbi:hypothetical protein CCP2SC5_100035 [Azospirillaceae bacterium]